MSTLEIDSFVPAFPRDVLTAAQLEQHASKLLRILRDWTRLFCDEFVDRFLYVLSLDAGRNEYKHDDGF
jgi:hypothetical protein